MIDVSRIEAKHLLNSGWELDSLQDQKNKESLVLLYKGGESPRVYRIPGLHRHKRMLEILNAA